LDDAGDYTWDGEGEGGEESEHDDDPIVDPEDPTTALKDVTVACKTYVVH